jgi:FlaA1/EpsC-like NDP-sugar epimerase
MDDKKSNYGRFLAMVGTSTALMFVLMYLNTYEFSHVRWSETRFYMTFVMGATMAVVMLLFMLGMYRNTKVNLAIFIGSAVVFVGALWLVRSQATIEDEAWMKAMIPHHSIAILTSERADIDDVRVRKLADEIISAQRHEIREMEWLLNDIETNGTASTEAEASSRPPPDFDDEE